MSKKISNKTKKAICIYIVALLSLYIVIEVLPRVTDIFETTMILKPGTITQSCSTEGYLIKEERIGVAGESGDIKYLIPVETAVKKGHPVVSINGSDSKANTNSRFDEYMNRLKSFDGISNDYDAPISGIFSLSMDGYEGYFTSANMEKVKKETVEGLVYKSVDLQRNSALKGEPIYKISSDDNWYVLCWVDKATAKTYQENQAVNLEMPDGNVNAKVYRVSKDGEFYRAIFYSDKYYSKFTDSRRVDMNVIISDNSGLLIENKCIIEKNGEQGVYVKNKNGDYVFKRISIIASDEKESVIKDTTFLNEEGHYVTTVNVYDEVLKRPQSALEKDLKKESVDKTQNNSN